MIQTFYFCLLKQISFLHATLGWASRLQACCSSPPLYFLITVPLGFSLYATTRNISPPLLCAPPPSLSHSNSSTPSSHWDGHHDSSRLALSARMNRRCREKAERPYSCSLTSKGKDCAVRMLISLHLNLQPAGKHLNKTPAIHHIQTAASSISCTPKPQRNQPIGASWQTLTAAIVWTYINMSAKYECKQVLPLVKKMLSIRAMWWMQTVAHVWNTKYLGKLRI